MTFNKCSINEKIYGYIYDSNYNEMEITEVKKFNFFMKELSN